MTINKHQRRTENVAPETARKCDEEKVLEKIGRIFGIGFQKPPQADKEEGLARASSETYISYAWTNEKEVSI